MKSFVEIDRSIDGNYLKLLAAVSKLSNLFSENSIPYLNYRVAENIFCRSFNAKNLSRSDIAFDANYNSQGIGIKTFISQSNYSSEKVAEFNSIAKDLSKFEGKDLAIKLAENRNARIEMANRLYDLESSIYHIIARRSNELLLFETDYEKIDIEKISSIKASKASLQFEDGKNQYSYNFSKSTLFRKFFIPSNAFSLPIEIIEDPFEIILELLKSKELKKSKPKLIRGENYVILPLYGKKDKEKFVFEKSGLNQWNAEGRKRDYGEVYIPIPIEIHKKFPNFFPNKDKVFNLSIPSGDVFKAKVCQENSKALMTNPNNSLADWLLRKVFQVEEGQLVTIGKMNELGFDSVIIFKENENTFSIDKVRIDGYEDFIENRFIFQ
jgi:hypothetical protein